MYTEDIAIKALKSGADLSDQSYATWWLGKMRSRHPETIGLLIRKLSTLQQSEASVDERGVGLNAIRSLGTLNALEAGEPLIALLNINDVQIRAEVARSLGTMKLTSAKVPLASLLRLHGDESLTDPQEEDMLRAVMKAIGMIGNPDSSTRATLEGFSHHPQPLLRSASCCALLRLTGLAAWSEPIKVLLHHDDPLVRRGALLDLGSSGWADALDPIQSAAVENSLKLIALKSLAEEQPMEDQPNEAVLNAMDRLL